jgi:hypothetical protein
MMGLLQGILGTGKRLSLEEDRQLDRLLSELTPKHVVEDCPTNDFLNSYCSCQRELAREASEMIFGNTGVVEVSDEALRNTWSFFEEQRKLVKRHRSQRRNNPRTSKVLATHRFDADTVLLLGKIGALFGSFLSDSIRSLEWSVGDPGDIVNGGFPVLGDFPCDIHRMNPTRVLVTIANRHADDHCPDALKNLHTRWVEPATTTPNGGS